MNRKVTILMVDDRPENLVAMRAVLDSPDYRLVGLASGEMTLKYLLREPTEDLAVIIMDVQMPGMDGYETTRWIKERHQTRDIPIIFITASNTGEEHVLQGYRSGSADYIVKPFQPEILKHKVEAFVQLHRCQMLIRDQKMLLEKRTEELEQANGRLTEAEAFTRKIVETSAEAILVLDGEGLVINVNHSLENLIGWNAEEMIGQPVERFVAALGRGQLESLPRELEANVAHKNGKVMTLEIRTGRSQAFGTLMLVCSLTDITEKKRMEAAREHQVDKLQHMIEERTEQLELKDVLLRRSREMFQSIFLSSPHMLALYRTEDSRCIDVNESWQRNTGHTLEEAKQYQGDLLHMKVEETGEPPVLAGAVSNLKVLYRTKGGELRYGLLSSEFITVGDEQTILLSINDITEKVIWEAEMGRLERLNLIGEMAAGIAHEIRNPMTTIRGFLQLSKSKKSGMTTDYIDLMLKELDRANGIITEFLTLAKNRTSDFVLEPINGIVQSLLPLIQAEATMSGKIIRVECGEVPELWLDEKEIRQLILNLAINGLEAMSPGGTVTIRTELQGNEVVLEVSDEGEGIKQEYLDRIGTPFFTTKEKGTGLGLAVCYSVAAKHQALLDIRTGCEGTTFVVRFPLPVSTKVIS